MPKYGHAESPGAAIGRARQEWNVRPSLPSYVAGRFRMAAFLLLLLLASLAIVADGRSLCAEACECPGHPTSRCGSGEVYVVDADLCMCCDRCLPIPENAGGTQLCSASWGLRYAFRCDAQGLFEAVQCSGNHCWCANAASGQPYTNKVHYRSEYEAASTCEDLELMVILLSCEKIQYTRSEGKGKFGTDPDAETTERDDALARNVEVDMLSDERLETHEAIAKVISRVELGIADNNLEKVVLKVKRDNGEMKPTEGVKTGVAESEGKGQKERGKKEVEAKLKSGGNSYFSTATKGNDFNLTENMLLSKDVISDWLLNFFTRVGMRFPDHFQKILQVSSPSEFSFSKLFPTAIRLSAEQIQKNLLTSPRTRRCLNNVMHKALCNYQFKNASWTEIFNQTCRVAEDANEVGTTTPGRFERGEPASRENDIDKYKISELNISLLFGNDTSLDLEAAPCPLSVKKDLVRVYPDFPFDLEGAHNPNSTLNRELDLEVEPGLSEPGTPEKASDARSDGKAGDGMIMDPKEKAKSLNKSEDSEMRTATIRVPVEIGGEIGEAGMQAAETLAVEMHIFPTNEDGEELYGICAVNEEVKDQNVFIKSTIPKDVGTEEISGEE